MKKRILSLILTVAMMLSVMTILPFSVSAEEATFSTTQLKIYNLADFQKFNDLVADGENFSGKTVELAADVTLPADWNGVGAFNKDANRFSGTFEGNGHTITVSGTRGAGEDVGGVFDYVVDGTLQNFNVVGSLTTSCNYFAGVVGAVAGNTTLKNLHVSVDIQAGNLKGQRVGGIVATICKYVQTSNLIFEGCVYDGTMNFSNEAVLCGGFLAATHSDKDVTVIFKDCVYAGKMSFNYKDWTEFNGGFVGGVQYDATAEFYNCVSVGKMTFRSDVTFKDRNGVAVGLYEQNKTPITIENFYYVGFNNGTEEAGSVKAVSPQMRTKYTSGDYVTHEGSYGTATNVEEKTLAQIAALTAEDFDNAGFSFKASTDLDTYYPCPTGLVKNGEWVNSLHVSADAKVLGASIRITAEGDKYSGIRFEAKFRETVTTGANTANANFGLILISKTAYETWSALEGENKTFAALVEAGVKVSATKATTNEGIVTVKAVVYEIDKEYYEADIVAIPYANDTVIGDAVARSIYSVAKACVEANNDPNPYAVPYAKEIVKAVEEVAA